MGFGVLGFGVLGVGVYGIMGFGFWGFGFGVHGFDKCFPVLGDGRLKSPLLILSAATVAKG